MEPLFYIDIAALGFTAFISSALLFGSIGAGIKTAANRCFASFILAVLGWVIAFILLRVSFIAEVGRPQLDLDIGAIFFALSGPLLFSFAAHYKKKSTKYHDTATIIGIVLVLAMTYPMALEKIVFEPRLASNGATVITVTPLAWICGVIPGFFFTASFVILWRYRDKTADAYIALGPLFFLGGLILDGLISLPFPFLPLFGAAGVLVLGHGVTKRQIFNPLRELTTELEEQVLERTLELEQSHVRMEKEISDRTAELRREIEERARTEIELRESEQKFRTFSERSPNMVFINKAGRVVYANNRCEELMGYSREEFLAEDFDFKSIIAPESLPIIEQNFGKHLAGENVEPYEYVLVTKDGKRIDSIIQTRLIDYEGQKAILGIVTDIRSQKKTQRLLQTLNVAALDLERSLKPAELVPIAHRYLREIGYFMNVYWADEEARTFSDMLNPEGSNLTVSQFPELEALLHNRDIILLYEDDPLYHTIGERISPETASCNSGVLIPLVTENEGRGFMAVLGDEIKENELAPLSVFANQLAASYRRSRLMGELSASVDRLKDTQDELAHAQRMEAIGRLSGGIAHDFNNILTAIHGCAELIQAELPAELDSEATGHVEEIKRAVRQASGLTQQLLAFSRKQVIERRDIGLNSVIRNVETLLRRVIGEDISFELELGKNLGTVSVDERQFEQVLMNLAVNARDAMPHGGKITVRTFRRTMRTDEAAERDFKPGPYCVLTFSDTGVGMDSETRRRVFEPFFTTKEFGKGTGLGMSTVYGIVRQCDGYIVVESEPERGTTYLIYLPETGGEIIEKPQPGEESESDFNGKEVVLVVEDDRTVQRMTRQTLEKYGYSVLVASDAAEAVDICRREEKKIDVMLTDVVMPGGMSGFELADWIIDNYPEIKTMYMSGYADEAVTRKSIHENSAFLKKPFSTRALLQTLREVCEGKVQI